MLICANCGNERPEGTRFCGNCGTPFVPPDQQLSSAEPPAASSPRNKRLLWVVGAVVVALLLAGGGVAGVVLVTGGESTPTEGLLDSITNTTDVFPTDDATTSGVDDAIGQGVDQTCEDIVAFFALSKETDMARGGNSVDDVEEVASAVADLASRAPREPEGSLVIGAGEPRDSLASIAEAYGAYARLLSDLDLEPGPDALLEPRIADALADVSIDVSLGLLPWIDARCSSEHKAQLEELVTG